MKITREADYALRILYTIKNSTQIISAREVSVESGVSLRFTLKILSKLGANAMVDSKKGAQGGYFLKKSPDTISLEDIVECIDGPINISHCLEEGVGCTRISDKCSCDFRKVFEHVSLKIRQELAAVKLSQF